MLTSDFKEFLESLNANNVRYLVVGGFAVAIHGYPRYTKDIDIWVEMERENATNLIHALSQFGFDSLHLKVEDFLIEDQIIQLGYPPSRIDILVTLPGVDFVTCYKARKIVVVDEIPVSFIDKADLIKNKQASGRHQDLADLENLGE